MLVMPVLLLSCGKGNIPERAKEAEIVNSFYMEVDGLLWEPGQLGDETCIRTYSGAWSWLGETPYFTISAWRDPKERIDVDSENVLQIQIMNVVEPGKYILTGSQAEAHQSHAFFQITKPDKTYKRYVNKQGKGSFTVEFAKFIPRPNISQQGVEGVFYGTLFNEANPLDSIVITKGTFILKNTNRHNFDQCDR